MNTTYFAYHERAGVSSGATKAPTHAQRPRSAPRCANCDIEITWIPVISNGLTYCCSGCAQGGPCSCDYAEHQRMDSRV